MGTPPSAISEGATCAQQTKDVVRCRVSCSIPPGMVIWTNHGAVVGVHMPGSGVPRAPQHYDLVHFSAGDFPRGLPGVARITPDGRLSADA